MRDDVIQQAEVIREAMDAAGAVLTEEQALSCVYLFRAYEVGKHYYKDDYFVYGLNAVGDPQLYRVEQEHTSQADWKPGETPALYTAVGLDDSGHPVWAKPTGAHDAYDYGDIVNYNGVLYRSEMDGNVYSPDEYPDAWKEVEA